MRSAIRPEAWKRFLDRLARNGFFEGELEGSKRYREKISMAEVSFIRCPMAVVVYIVGSVGCASTNVAGVAASSANDERQKQYDECCWFDTV